MRSASIVGISTSVKTAGRCVRQVKNNHLTFRGRSARYCSTQSDESLQRQASSVVSKLSTLIGLATDNGRFEEFAALQASKALPFGDTIEAARVYVELQNPLLSKYNVDIKDILSGAKQACEAVTAAVGSEDFVVQPEHSSSREFLVQVLSSPHLHFLETLRSLRTSLGRASFLKEIEVIDTTLLDIGTQIVPDRATGVYPVVDALTPYVAPVVEYTILGLVSIFYGSSKSVTYARQMIEKWPNEAPLSAYPPGSVLAIVVVNCGLWSAAEELRWDPGSSDISQAQRKTVKAYKDERFTFRACISGQVPLQWRLVGGNGAARRSKY
jgi:hypothetical protein